MGIELGKLDQRLGIPQALLPLRGKYLFRFIGLFFISLFLALGCSILVTRESANPYSDGVDFTSLGLNDLLVTNRLRESQITGIKVRYANKASSPFMGVFGSHAIAGFSSTSAGGQKDYFFNYGVTHIGLPEVRDLMAHLGENAKLPREYIFVALQNPHTANFDHINQYIGELPSEIYLFNGGERPTKNLRRAFSQFGRIIRDRLDWRNIVYELVGACRPEYRVINLADAPLRKKRAVLGEGSIGKIITKILNTSETTDHCPRFVGLLQDGRNTSQIPASPISLEPVSTPVKPVAISGGAESVLSIMLEINMIGNKDGYSRVVFFVPPVLEIERKSPQASLVDRLIHLARLKGLRVIDDRKTYNFVPYFHNYMHPNEKYFETLVDRTKRHK